MLTGLKPPDLDNPAAPYRWADANGIRRSIAPSTFDGGLRGASASEGIKEGQSVVSVPEALLITAETARSSDFGQALQRLPLDEQSLLLLWIMVERHDADAQHAALWRALPQEIHTGALG